MTHQPHPYWGRSLDQYTSSYTIHNAKERVVRDASSRLAAQEAIQEICNYDSTALNSNLASDVTITTLRYALNSASNPEALEDYLHPRLISGCIALMARVKPDGTTFSPLSYEYWYLCFRILTIALGACILSRTNNLRMTIDNMAIDEQTELLLIFSGHVARVIQDVITATRSTRRCDWVLGWTVSKKHPPQSELVSRMDTRLLLNVLWDDRTCFLRAFRATYFPGLTGVLFLLWRYIYLERALGEHPNPDVLVAPFCEIHWRYLLVSTTDQDIPLVQIGNDLCSLSNVWDKSPKVTSLEDSRVILNAYITRLEPTDTRLYAPLGPSVVPLLFRLVVPNMVSGSVDLLPPLFRLTINRLWGALRNQEAPDDLFIGCTDAVLAHFIMLFDYLRQGRTSSREIMKPIVDAMAETDFLDFIGSMMLLLNPDAEEPSAECDANYSFWSSTQELFGSIADMVPRSYLEQRFRYYTKDWLRYKAHLFVVGKCMESADGSSTSYHRRNKHYRFCDGTWETMVKALGQQEPIDATGERRLQFSKVLRSDGTC